MKKRISISLLLFLFLFTGLLSSCSQDNDILATSKIKDITRNDFYDWLEAKKISTESILDSRNKQIEKLENMAIEMFTIDKARREGFDKSPSFLLLKKRVEEFTLQKYFFLEIDNRATYNDPAVRVSYILLFLNRYKQDPDDRNIKIRLEDQEVEKKYNELLLKAKGLVQRLDEGESFAKLASEFSEDATKKSGGEFGYILYDMMPDFFSEAAFGLEKGEYTKTPVRARNGIYIIKVEDKAILTKKNIDEVIEDKNQREKIKARLLNKYRSEYIENLMTAEGVDFLLKGGESFNSNDVLFRVGGKEYTASEIEKILEKRATPEELEEASVNGVLPDSIKIKYAKTLFRYLIWSRDAVRLEIDKKPEYQEELERNENTLLAIEYIKRLSSRSVFVSDQDVREEYERGKNKKYIERANKKEALAYKPKALEFEDVKDEIYKELVNEIKLKRAQEWKDQVLKEYDFRINESKLEGT